MFTIVGRNSIDMGTRIDAITWALTAISGAFLGTRLYVRLTQSRLWWDDHLLSASWLLLVIHASIATYAVQRDFGKHADTVSEDDLLVLVLLVSIAGVFTLFAAAWSKTAFAITLLRLTDGRLKVFVWTIIVSLNLILFVNAILPFVRCIPIGAAWNSAAGGTCFDINITIRFSLFAAAYSAMMDWLLALVPWAVIMSLNMRNREKIGVAICMSLGFVAGVTSIIRCIKIPLLQSDDFTFRAGELAIWTAAEIATTIMATSIPILRVFLQKMVTAHPDIGQGANFYHRSAADGTLLQSLQSASKCTEHTTVITSGRRISVGVKASGGRSQGPENNGKIMKVDTVVVNYDQRKGDEERACSMLVSNGGLNARSSIELDDMPELRTHSSKDSSR